MIPAVLALMHLLRDREPLLAHLGGALSLIGLVGWCSVVVIYGLVLWQMGVAGDRAEMTALFDRLIQTPGVVIPTRIAAFGVVVGMICLAAGLFRARVVPVWSCPAMAAGLVQFAVGAQNELLWLMTLGTICLTAGLGAIGFIVLQSRTLSPPRRGFGLWREDGPRAEDAGTAPTATVPRDRRFRGSPSPRQPLRSRRCARASCLG